MIVVGLTGSIGMGKSTTADMFAHEGVPVADADRIVHRLYAGRAAPAIEEAFPGTTGKEGVDRELLAKAVLGNPTALRRLEAIVHPLVREEQRKFLEKARAEGASIALLDIPLLFETDGQDRVDRVVVVSCPVDIQRERVMARPGMTREKFEAILERQVPDAEKRKRADFVIETGLGLEAARRQVAEVVARLRSQAAESEGRDAGDRLRY